MRRLVAGGCVAVGGVLFLLGVALTLGGGGFDKAQSESAPYILVRVYETIQASAMMVSGAVFLAAGLVASGNGASRP